MQALTIYQVDSFTSQKFKGNPAAVCITESPLPGELMQNIALEMNLSETAFLAPTGENTYNIKFFTPAVEVDLCGHATLASAHTLFEIGLDADSTITFHSNVGPLIVTKSGSWINMNFPVSELEQREIPEGLSTALGVPVKEVLEGDQWKVIVLENEAAVRKSNGSPGPLLALDCGHITITAISDQKGVDYVNRVFAAKYGIPEDPVTGSAQTVLTPYWHQKLRQDSYTCHQLSDRTGILRTKVLPDNRVLVSGEAVSILKAELLV